METLKECAQAYEPKQTRKISELDRIPTDIEVEDDKFSYIDKNGAEVFVKQKVIVIEGEKYKVPLIVLGSLREHLKENPDLKYFKVNKSGEGLKTRYTVIPLGNGGAKEELVSEV